jgi:hypothetical protein
MSFKCKVNDDGSFICKKNIETFKSSGSGKRVEYYEPFWQKTDKGYDYPYYDIFFGSTNDGRCAAVCNDPSTSDCAGVVSHDGKCWVKRLMRNKIPYPGANAFFTYDIDGKFTTYNNTRFKDGNLIFAMDPDDVGICDKAINRCINNPNCAVVNYNGSQYKCIARSSAVGKVYAKGDTSWQINGR